MSGDIANRPMWPRTAELFAQADEAIADIRSSHARIDRSLAEIVVAVTATPFPDLIPFGQSCSCAFGPRCESNRCCEDEAATMGIKDQRTGTIRKRATVSFFHPFQRGPVPRLKFYCGDCFAALKESWGKPIRGIHPPRGASDFYQPSLLAMVQLSAMEIRQRERTAQRPPATYDEAAERHTLERMKRWTPAQRAQADYMRRQMKP